MSIPAVRLLVAGQGALPHHIHFSFVESRQYRTPTQGRKGPRWVGGPRVGYRVCNILADGWTPPMIMQPRLNYAAWKGSSEKQ